MQLSKTRTQHEADNKFTTLEDNKSVFLWDFVDFKRDVVTPYQKFWQADDSDQGIISAQQKNGELSLNFSAEFINPQHHQQLLITAPSHMSGHVVLQITTGVEQQDFYYSDKIALNGLQTTIDLKRSWRTLQDNHTVDKVDWGSSLINVTSIVLYFDEVQLPFNIDNIALLTNKGLQFTYYPVNCQGRVLSDDIPDNKDMNIFTVTETCWFPSNYMWLNQYLQHDFPESILRTGKWQNSSQYHQVNQSYSNNWFINTLLYGFIMMVFVLLSIFVLKFRKDKNSKKYGSWVEKYGIMFGYKIIRPYHLALNYIWVLLPSSMVFILLCLFKWPTLDTFKVFPMYCLWALVQQFFLVRILAEGVFFERLESRILASCCASLVFAVIHLPSVTLMLATFFAGCFWTYAGLLFKRLLPLAISHAMLALMFYHVVDERFLFSAKVLQWFWK